MDVAAERANNKKIAAQKTAERTEKKLHKKAKTEEMTRRRTNQENKCMYLILLCDTCIANISYRAIRHPATGWEHWELCCRSRSQWMHHLIIFSNHFLMLFQFTVHNIPAASNVKATRCGSASHYRLRSTDVASLYNHHLGFPCFLRAAAAAAPSAGAVAARAAAV